MSKLFEDASPTIEELATKIELEYNFECQSALSNSGIQSYYEDVPTDNLGDDAFRRFHEFLSECTNIPLCRLSIWDEANDHERLYFIDASQEDIISSLNSYVTALNNQE